MNSDNGFYNAKRLDFDRQYRKSFVTDLQKYLKENMSQAEIDEQMQTSDYDLIEESFYEKFRHSINFCNIQKVNYLAALIFFFPPTYGSLYCDSHYLYNLKVTDDDVEAVSRTVSVTLPESTYMLLFELSEKEMFNISPYIREVIRGELYRINKKYKCK